MQWAPDTRRSEPPCQAGEARWHGTESGPRLPGPADPGALRQEPSDGAGAAARKRTLSGGQLQGSCYGHLLTPESRNFRRLSKKIQHTKLRGMSAPPVGPRNPAFRCVRGHPATRRPPGPLRTGQVSPRQVSATGSCPAVPPNHWEDAKAGVQGQVGFQGQGRYLGAAVSPRALGRGDPGNRHSRNRKRMWGRLPHTTPRPATGLRGPWSLGTLHRGPVPTRAAQTRPGVTSGGRCSPSISPSPHVLAPCHTSLFPSASPGPPGTGLRPDLSAGGGSVPSPQAPSSSPRGLSAPLRLGRGP